MTQLPPDELAALPGDPMPRVCELGNKKNSTGLYRDWYENVGMKYLCVDWNGLDGALHLDMRGVDAWKHVTAQHDDKRFPLVTNFGFTEHVGDNILEQLECWRNVHHLVASGGFLSICMPIMPDWKGHGRWMPTPEWYVEFAKVNGYSIEFSKIWDRVRRTCVMRLRKYVHQEFVHPVFTRSVQIVRSDLK